MLHPPPVPAAEIYSSALKGSPHSRFYARSPSTRLVQATIPRYLRPGLAVLDLGCGNAVGACHLAASGGRELTYLGIDPDAAACQWARRVLKGLPTDRVRGRIIQQSLQEYVAAARSRFDLIVCSWAFRRCIDVRQPATHTPLTAAIADLLVPDGVLLVGDSFVAPGATDTEVDRIRRYHDEMVSGHATGHPIFPPTLIAALFTRAGLIRLEHHDILALPLARFLGMPHDRYCLQVFRRASRAG